MSAHISIEGGFTTGYVTLWIPGLPVSAEGHSMSEACEELTRTIRTFLKLCRNNPRDHEVLEADPAVVGALNELSYDDLKAQLNEAALQMTSRDGSKAA